MANITKMFIHYNHTKAEFIAAGLESTYANSIVFISGADKEAPCIYTHNNYFANVQDALDAIASLSYIKGVKVGDKTFTAPANGEGAVIPFASADPATVSVDTQAGTITFGLTDPFKAKVDNTAKNLGTSTDASTAGTAFGEIARLDALIGALVGGEGGSIEGMIKNQINNLDASVTSEAVNGVQVRVEETDGKVSKVTVVSAPDASKIVDDKINAAIQALDSSAEGSSNGFKVKVEQTDGKLSGVTVTAPDVDGKISTAIQGLDSSAEDTDNGIYVKVTEVDGKITAVDVSAADIVANYKEAISEAIKALDSSAEDTDNGIYVKVTEVDGKITAVEVDASGMNGKADLDAAGKILAEQLPDYILGQVLFGGTIDGSGKVTASDSYKSKYGDTTVVPDASTVEGAYFIATGSGELSGIDYTPTPLEYTTGDWIISTGAEWVKVDNTDAVSSVAGLTGAIASSALAKALAETGDANELALKSEVDGVNTRIDNLDASLSDSSNGFGVSFEQENGLVKNLKVSAPDVDGKISAAIQALDAEKDDTDNGIYVKVTEVDGKITAVDVSANDLVTNYKKDISDAINALDASLDASSNGFAVSFEQEDGKVKNLKVSAPDVDGKISAAIQALDSSAEGSNNGVKVKVDQTDGKLTGVTVNTTIADTSVAGSTGLVDIAGLRWMFSWEEL